MDSRWEFGEIATLERNTVLPTMLETFLGGDAGFKRARKALHDNASRKG